MEIKTWPDCSVYGGALEKDSSNTKLAHRTLWLNSGHLLRWVRKTKRDTCSRSLGRAWCCQLTLKMLPARKPQQMYFLDFQNYGTNKNLFFIKFPSVWCSILVMERRLSGATHTHAHLPLNCLCELTCLNHLLLSPHNQSYAAEWLTAVFQEEGGESGYKKTEEGKYREKAEGGKTERTERKTSFVTFANFSNYSCHDWHQVTSTLNNNLWTLMKNLHSDSISLY